MTTDGGCVIMTTDSRCCNNKTIIEEDAEKKREEVIKEEISDEFSHEILNFTSVFYLIWRLNKAFFQGDLSEANLL